MPKAPIRCLPLLTRDAHLMEVVVKCRVHIRQWRNWWNSSLVSTYGTCPQADAVKVLPNNRAIKTFRVRLHDQIQFFVFFHYFTNAYEKPLQAFLSYFLSFLFFSKRTLLLNNIPAIIGSLMMFSSYYAKGPALLIIGRVFFGFNNGMCLYVCCLM